MITTKDVVEADQEEAGQNQMTRKEAKILKGRRETGRLLVKDEIDVNGVHRAENLIKS